MTIILIYVKTEKLDKCEEMNKLTNIHEYLAANCTTTGELVVLTQPIEQPTDRTTTFGHLSDQILNI